MKLARALLACEERGCVPHVTGTRQHHGRGEKATRLIPSDSAIVQNEGPHRS